MVSAIERFHCIQDSQLGPSGVLYREVPLYVRGSEVMELCAGPPDLALDHRQVAIS